MSVLVYIEDRKGTLPKQSLEIASYSAHLAKMQGTDVAALVMGKVENDELNKLSKFGITSILKSDDDRIYSSNPQLLSVVISQAIDKTNAKTIVFAHNGTGKAVAPRLSAKLKAGLATAVVGLPDSMNPFSVYKKVFTGKAFASLEIYTEIKILTLSPNTHEIVEINTNLNIEKFNPEIPENLQNIKVLETSAAGEELLLSEADIVVSGGRGMKGPENWSLIEDLANEMGAATACSRPVSDEGWRDHSEHVGQTGKVIAPNLYIAAGISGAIQHIGGVNSSKCIVAINKDEDAPIFETADYGIVGDVMKVFPELLKAYKEFKSS
ncbi:MAG: electron transfer flavoprotein subunit alpha/FixB family protein [Bacteroidales bacterium]|nr:electron transfer flavoprotein subunit alpha/FixB family protein [Bacteroidales bacterium]